MNNDLMAGPSAPPIDLSERVRAILEQMVRRHKSPQRLVRRARMLLEASINNNNEQVAYELDSNRNTVRHWRGRWLEAAPALEAAEAKGDDNALAGLIEKTLADEPRAGAPATFTAEQIVRIVALGCEAPSDSGRPVSHWTPSELVDEAIKRGIVDSISPRTVGRFLKSGRSEAPSEPLLAQLGPRRSGGLRRERQKRM
jgi:putative transposase